MCSTTIILVLLLTVYLQNSLQVTPSDTHDAIQALHEHIEKIEKTHAQFVQEYSEVEASK